MGIGRISANGRWAGSPFALGSPESGTTHARLPQYFEHIRSKDTTYESTFDRLIFSRVVAGGADMMTAVLLGIAASIGVALAWSIRRRNKLTSASRFLKEDRFNGF